MAASGYSKHDDWLFPIFRRAVTDLSLGLQTGASVGTTGGLQNLKTDASRCIFFAVSADS